MTRPDRPATRGGDAGHLGPTHEDDGAGGTTTLEAHVPDPAENERDKHYFPGLDGARALAALGVLVNHVGVLSGYNFRNEGIGQYIARADVGVSVFFVLSGFLLYRPFVVDRLEGLPHRDVSAYARRRLLRIFPAYWVALTIVAFVMQAPPFEEPQSIVAHYLLLQVYDINQVVGGPIQQSWTLATELSFYLFLPIWAWFMSRRRRTPQRQLRAELIGVTALWAACIAIKLGGLAIGMSAEHYGMVGTWLIFRIDEFALGMLIAIFSAWWTHADHRVPAWLTNNMTTVVCWAISAVIFWITCTQLGLPLSPLVSAKEAFAMRVMYSFSAAFLIVPAVFAAQRMGLAKGVLANRVMVWLGLVSYGIYLWHEAWQDKWLDWTGEQVLAAGFLGMLAFTTLMSIVSGAGSWYLVERPSLKFGRRGSASRRSSSPTLGTEEMGTGDVGTGESTSRPSPTGTPGSP